MASSKKYTSLGVQTDDVPDIKSVQPLATSDFPQFCDGESVVSLPPPTASERLKRIQGAYMYSDGSPDIILSPVTDHEHDQRRLKYSELSYNRPSEYSNPSEGSRIVSLPETAPLFSAKASTRRVVSLTGTVPSMLSEGLDYSGEFSQSSTSTSGGFTNPGDDFDTSGQFRRLGLPRTPSPPSSPDSVTIISNPEVQVPAVFLRTDKQEDPSRRLQGVDDVNGWVSWAHSPPRPIPALHGPLSLPYARCPSGAEGTVIEQPAEIPRVIWGLSSDEARSHNGEKADGDPNAYDRHTPKVQPTSVDLVPDELHQRGLRPGTKSLPGPYSTQSSFQPPARPTFNHYSSSGTRFPSPERKARNIIGWNENDSRIHLDQPSRSLPSCNLNLDQVRQQTLDSNFIANGLRLFIPKEGPTRMDDTSTSAYLERHTQGRAHYLPGRQAETWAQNGQSVLTLDNPTSPRWTPLFSSYLDMFGSPDTALFNPPPATPRLSTKPLPQIQEPVLASTVDILSEELRRFVLKEITCPGNNGAVASARESFEAACHEIPSGSNNPQLATPQSPYQHRAPTTMSPLQPRPPPNSPMSSLPAYQHDIRRAIRFTPTTKLSSSSSPDPVLASSTPSSGRQPRSIPFARLMQRRLSVVREEDPLALPQPHQNIENIPPAHNEPTDYAPHVWGYRSHNIVTKSTPKKEPWVRTAGDPNVGRIMSQSATTRNLNTMQQGPIHTDDGITRVQHKKRPRAKKPRSIPK